MAAAPKKKATKKTAKKAAKKSIVIKVAKKASSNQEETKRRPAVTAYWAQHRVITEPSDAARELHSQAGYGTLLEDGKVQLSLLEALYLLERGRLRVQDGRGQAFTSERLLKRAVRAEPDFWVRYMVFRDIRTRGYIIKTALKFGADFRIYDRGIKPGEDHARWVVFPVHEGETLTWHEFAAKNRVAHSTKKRLMLGVVDDEGDVSYWEVRWLRP